MPRAIRLDGSRSIAASDSDLKVAATRKTIPGSGDEVSGSRQRRCCGASWRDPSRTCRWRASLAPARRRKRRRSACENLQPALDLALSRSASRGRDRGATAERPRHRPGQRWPSARRATWPDPQTSIAKIGVVVSDDPQSLMLHAAGSSLPRGPTGRAARGSSAARETRGPCPSPLGQHATRRERGSPHPISQDDTFSPRLVARNAIRLALENRAARRSERPVLQQHATGLAR